MIYFYYKMEQSLNSLINTHVLDIDKKHPHYIYLKYSIYKEQLAEMKNSQTHDKVSIYFSYFIICFVRIHTLRCVFMYVPTS